MTSICLQRSLGLSGTPRMAGVLPGADQSVLLLTASLFAAPELPREARGGTVVQPDYGGVVLPVCVAIRVVVTTCRFYGVFDYGVLRTIASETSQQCQGARRAKEMGRPSGSPDPWAATAKSGSLAWAEGRVLGARIDEELLLSSRLEGRKKVPPSFSHTVDNASATCITTTRMRPVGALRQREYRNEETRCDISPKLPQQQQAQQPAQDEGVIEPLLGTHYDILKHLDHVPAKISILELIKKSKECQEALRDFLQKVVVNEDMLADKLPSALAMVTRGPAITFAESELAPPEARRLPLCVILVINHVAVGAALVDTGASINVCPLSTLRACDLSEGMLRPTPTTIAAYDNSRRSCHGMVTVQAELGPLAVTVDFYVLDIDPMFKAILGRPWLEALGAVPSTAHQCLKFPFQGRIIKVKSIATTHSVDAIHNTHLPTVWPANKPVVSVLDINYPWSYSFQSKREVNLAQVHAIKRKEPLSTKGLQIMMKLGYEEGKGLGTELQGIV
ncbi:hypothetical protein Taro_009567 [Colocasia esculenta]|uniref:G-patch domain-containing protein n=1 Tax=Colocasia esculenta TaxID=4460 RepID=A0A843UAB6_COLES|nr:hypothetical protein [Colocasia esculenta]